MNRFYVMLCLVVGWQKATAQPLTPAQIFAKTIAVYESAATYQDTGEAGWQVKRNDPHWYERADFSAKKPFQTAYIRKTGQFRFRYQDAKPGSTEIALVVWSDGKQVKTWDRLHGKVRQGGKVQDALTPFTGTSATSSIRVPGLLLNFKHSWQFDDLSKTVLLPAETQSGHLCYHIRGMLHRENPFGVTAKSSRPIKGPTEKNPSVEIWIDTSTFLIIRIVEFFNRGTEEHRDIMTYYPVLNQPVKPEALVFDYKNY